MKDNEYYDLQKKVKAERERRLKVMELRAEIENLTNMAKPLKAKQDNNNIVFELVGYEDKETFFVYHGLTKGEAIEMLYYKVKLLNKKLKKLEEKE